MNNSKLTFVPQLASSLHTSGTGAFRYRAVQRNRKKRSQEIWTEKGRKGYCREERVKGRKGYSSVGRVKGRKRYGREQRVRGRKGHGTV